jgi:hypothetical protein
MLCAFCTIVPLFYYGIPFLESTCLQNENRLKAGKRKQLSYDKPRERKLNS